MKHVRQKPRSCIATEQRDDTGRIAADGNRFLRIRDGVQVLVWNRPAQTDAMLSFAATGKIEPLAVALAEILRLLNGKCTLREVTRAIAERYDCSLPLARRVANGIIRQFEAEGVVETSATALPERSFPSPIVSPYHLRVLQLQVTNRCNLRCLHCYARSDARARQEFSTPDALRIIDEFASLGGAQLFITGGEPLLHRGIDQIVLHAKKRHLFVYLSTNGYLLTRESARRLAGLGVAAANVSVDGSNAETHDAFRGRRGAFARATRALDALVAEGITCASHTTLFAGNLDQYVDIENALRPRGVEQCFLVPMAPVGRGAEHANLVPTLQQHGLARRSAALNRKLRYGDRIYPEPLKRRTRRCSAAVSQLYVQADGLVFPCQALTTQGFCLGRYPDRPLAEIWATEEGNCAELRAFDASSMEECKTCVHRPHCRTGCFGVALLSTGDWRRPDPEMCLTMDILKEVAAT